MFTDIVGYSAMMAKDETKRMQILKKNRTLLKRLVEKLNGKWLKEIGDGTLSSFTSVLDAVNCGREGNLWSSENWAQPASAFRPSGWAPGNWQA